jgi:enterochelin esterase family protein
MQGKINFILDNLLAAKKAAPLLVVMDNGYAPRPGSPNPHRPERADNLFTDLVLTDLVPAIDRDFRTLADREHRAIAGLSMGAGQAMRIGLGHLDIFGSIGSFSGSVPNFEPKSSYDGVFKDPVEANRKIRLLWIGCGKLDFLYDGAQKLHQALEKHGIAHVWQEDAGSHEWQVWRQHIHAFAQVVFK